MTSPPEGKGAPCGQDRRTPLRSMRLVVHGIPAPGGSKSAFRLRGSDRIVVVDAGGARTKAWRARVAHEAALVMRGNPHFPPPIALTVEFRMPRPKAHYLRGRLRDGAPRWHATKPDATKLLRSTEDALTSIAWHDDAAIVSQRVTKAYADTPAEVGATITVEAAPA